MADELNPVEILMAYQARFGEDGAFDAWLLPPDSNLELMAQALERERPVNQRDLSTKYQELYDRPIPPPPPKGALT